MKATTRIKRALRTMAATPENMAKIAQLFFNHEAECKRELSEEDYITCQKIEDRYFFWGLELN